MCLRHEHRWCFLLKVKNNNIPYFHLVLIEWVKATTDYTSASSFYINNNKSFWWSEKLGVLLSCLVSINDSFMAMKYVSLAHGCTICGYSVSLRCSQLPVAESQCWVIKNKVGYLLFMKSRILWRCKHLINIHLILWATQNIKTQKRLWIRNKKKCCFMF